MSPTTPQYREPLRAIHGRLRWHVLAGFGAMAAALIVSAYVPRPGPYHYPALWTVAALAAVAGAMGTLGVWDRPGPAWLIGPALASAVLSGVAVWATGGATSYLSPLALGLTAVAAALLPTRWVVGIGVFSMILVTAPLWEGEPTADRVRQAIVLLPAIPFVAATIHAVKRITVQESAQRRYLSSLVRASELSARLDSAAALCSAAEGLQRELDADHAVVYLVDEQRRVLRPEVVLVRPEVLLPGEEELLRRSTPEVDSGLIGWVFRHAEPVLTGDAQADPRARRLPGLPARRLSAIIVPLVAGGQVLGVIRISRLGGNQFDEGDLQLATVFANQAAVAIQNARLYEEARRLTVIDPLTGLYNARSLQERLERELARARRYNRPLSLAMMDSDQLKMVNDRFGHLEGDRYLVRIAECIRAQLRVTDLAFRYAGDEFVVLLPETVVEDAVTVIDRIRREVEDRPLEIGGQAVAITISAGIAAYPTHATGEALLRAADEAMYRAKRQGKNRVEPQR